MRRREVISLLGGAAVAWPLAAWAQEAGRTYRLGVLVQSPRSAPHWVAFFEELRNYGFTEGVNLSMVGEFGAPLDRADTIANAVVEVRPDAILVGGAVFTHVANS